MRSIGGFRRWLLVLCQSSADGWYTLGVASWKTKTPGGCHGKALSSDVDGVGASRFAEAGQRGQGGGAETGSSKNPLVGGSIGRRLVEVRPGDCRSEERRVGKECRS